MKISTKKVCNGCKALRGIGLDQRCDLFYKMEIADIRKSWGTSYTARPLEPCPKPRTWHDWTNAETKK